MVSIKTYQQSSTTALSSIWILQTKLICQLKEKTQRRSKQPTIWLWMVLALLFTANNEMNSSLAAWARRVVSKISLRAWRSLINRKKALSANRRLPRSNWICSIAEQAWEVNSNRRVKGDLISCCNKIASLSTTITKRLLLFQTKSYLSISNKK